MSTIYVKENINFNVSNVKYNIIINIIIRVFCPRVGLSLQTQARRLQFCLKAGLPPQI